MTATVPLPTRAFCAYEFRQPRMEFFEELKHSLPYPVLDLYLPHQDYQPTMIWSRIRPEIDRSQLCIIDDEYSNPNVAFECGYAIGKGVPPILIRHHDTSTKTLQFLRAFQRLQYYTRNDLIRPLTELVSEPDWRSKLPLPIEDIAGVSLQTSRHQASHTDIYLLAVRARQDPVLKLKREFNRRPYSVHSDAIESPEKFSIRDIVKSIIRFQNIAIHLVGEPRSEYGELVALNSAASFFAGVAHGLGKEVRIFQQLPTPKRILDLESMLSTYETEAEAATEARSWKMEIGERADAIDERRRSAARNLSPPGLTSLPSDLGDPWAERDGLLDPSTYSVTSCTSRIRNGSGILYVGPRGCGKTADFIHLTRDQSSKASRITVAIKLTDADLISLRGLGKELFPDIDRHNIYRHIWRLVLTGLLVDEYLRLKAELASLESVSVLDDAAQLLEQFFKLPPGKSLAEMVEALIEAVDASSVDYTNSQELIRRLAFPEGRTIFAAALETFEIRIAIDGLDQGWDPSLNDAVELLVALVDEAHALELQYRPGLKITIFALQELYRDVSIKDRNRDKRSVEFYSWDRDQLADMIGARILAIADRTEGQEDPRDAWSIIFAVQPDGSSSFDYVVDRSLMRPRHLLRFCREALIRASNRRQVSVTLDDIVGSEELFSEQLVYDLSLEYTDRYPGIDDVALEFVEIDFVFPFAEFRERINAMLSARDLSPVILRWLSVDSNERVLVALKALYEVGFIEIVVNEGVLYSYMRPFERVWPRERRRSSRRRRERRRGRSTVMTLRYPNLVVHPAFHKGLAVRV